MIAVITLLLAVIIAVIITNANKDSQIIDVATPDTVAYVQESSVVYTTLSEIVDRSDVIVIARATAIKGIVNTARDPNDHTMPDPIYFSIGQIYVVRVDSYIKGDGSKLIYVIQNEGFIPSESQVSTSDDIEQAQKLSDSAPLIIGRQYIMFLSFHDPEYSYDDFPINEFLFAKGHPWRFEITNTECVQPEDGITELYIYFPAQSLEEFIQLIENPNSTTELPYPAPLSPTRCAPESITTNPYP
jgi:hypothetical protein